MPEKVRRGPASGPAGRRSAAGTPRSPAPWSAGCVPRRSRPMYPRASRRSSASTSGNSRSSAPSSPSLQARSSSVTAPGDGVSNVRAGEYAPDRPRFRPTFSAMFTPSTGVPAFHGADGLLGARGGTHHEESRREKGVASVSPWPRRPASAWAPPSSGWEDNPDQVLEWNQIFIDTLIATNTAELLEPAARSDRSHGDLRCLQRHRATVRRRSSSTKDAPPGASRRAAVIAAAHTALVGLFPSRKPQLDDSYAASLAALSDDGEDGGESRERGIAWGTEVAQAVLAWRATDGFNGDLRRLQRWTRDWPVAADAAAGAPPPTCGTMSAQGLAFTRFRSSSSARLQFQPAPPRGLLTSHLLG